MPARARPTSPHLGIYRWQIGNTLSILHRISGVALSVALLALSYWLIAIAGGPPSYAHALRLFGSPLGLLCLIGWTFAFCYHLLNGVRHLFWDAGQGFEKRQRHVSGWSAVAGSIVMTTLIWVVALRHVS